MTVGEATTVFLAVSGVELGVIFSPLLGLCGTFALLAVQLRNAKQQTEPTVLKIGHDALIEGNATLIRERDEARALADSRKASADTAETERDAARDEAAELRVENRLLKIRLGEDPDA